jgi:hypothetical protein
VSALLLLALAGCAGDERTTTTDTSPAPDTTAPAPSEPAPTTPPLFEGTAPAVTLVLPERFDTALHDDDSTMVTLPHSAFGPEILGGAGGWSYPFTPREAPFGVIADFDGNGTRDVALLQRADDEARAIVVLDVPPRPRVLTLRKWKRAEAGEPGPLSGFYLRLHPAGTIDVPDFGASGRADSVVTLPREGVQVVAWGKAARTYWYSNGDFVSLQTAD